MTTPRTSFTPPEKLWVVWTDNWEINRRLYEFTIRADAERFASLCGPGSRLFSFVYEDEHSPPGGM